MATDAIPPKKLKKLPFKPTALGRAASSRSKDPESDDYDVTKLFSRSREMAPALHAEEEERWKRKQYKLKKELEKSRLSAEKRPIDDDDDEEHGSPGASQPTEKASASGSQKRDARGDRHQEDSFSQADEEDEEAPRYGPALCAIFACSFSTVDIDISCGSLVTPPSSKRVRLDKSWSSKLSPGATSLSQSSVPESPSPRRSKRLAELPPSESPEVESTREVASSPICIESDDDEVEIARPSQSSTNVKIDDEEPVEDDIIEEEEEFAEYVQRAKEQRARDLSRDLDFDCDDKAVKVHVSSQIHGTRDCLVIVKYDKSLKDIRKSWFQTQAKFDISLPPGFTMSDSILTWCGAPVYSHTSLRDLAIRPCGSGKVTAPSSNRDGVSPDGTVVLMRIHTPDGFRIFEEEKRRKREADDFSDDEERELPESEAETLTINLAARDLEPAELKVQPETTVDTVITTYRAIQNIPSSRQVTLWFDGEMLEDYITMKDADIDDLDTIEVHIK
ncbi:unnamed protein product [Clonostachys rhizophaga]|uniref:Ubiquitin-like domain-containing protein n=1 Tax=Clonostachys rhizophaga TaxID=160324 RepID=A0A9N9V053_9HYPO|nr:unnamed protein product [Clonostachys rhizophaga]